MPVAHAAQLEIPFAVALGTQTKLVEAGGSRKARIGARCSQLWGGNCLGLGGQGDFLTELFGGQL